MDKSKFVCGTGKEMESELKEDICSDETDCKITKVSPFENETGMELDFSLQSGNERPGCIENSKHGLNGLEIDLKCQQMDNSHQNMNRNQSGHQIGIGQRDSVDATDVDLSEERQNCTNDSIQGSSDNNGVSVNNVQNVCKNGSYECLQCAIVFRTFYDLCDHLFGNPNSSPSYCDTCGTGFICHNQLLNHRHKTSLMFPELPYECDICAKGFTTKYLLQFHKHGHINPNLIQCGICKLSFASDGVKFVKHFRKHVPKSDVLKNDKLGISDEKCNKVDLFSCNVCSQTFHTPSDVYLHMKLHSNETYLCLNCGVGFNNFPRNKRYKHNLEHKTELSPLNHKCEICDQYFKKPELLDLHKEMHAGKNLFKCHACQRSFKMGLNLYFHLNDPQLKCSDLDKRKIFHQTKTLMLSNDEDYGQAKSCFNFVQGNKGNIVPPKSRKNIYNCEVCGETGETIHNFLAHLREHKLGRFDICGTCGKGVRFKNELPQHKLTHTTKDLYLYQCSTCHMMFKRADLLVLHNKIKHQDKKPFYCDYCKTGYGFLGKHMCKKFVKSTQEQRKIKKKKDQKKKVFKCEICLSVFHNVQLFDLHNQEVHLKGLKGEQLDLKCKLCSSEFENLQLLNIHQKEVHLKTCLVCHKTFETISEFQEHKKDHVEQNPYKCGFCGEIYNNIEFLLHHVNLHIQTVTGEFYVCGTCTMSFRNKLEFDAHKENHKYKVFKSCGCRVTIDTKLTVHQRVCTMTSKFKGQESSVREVARPQNDTQGQESNDNAELIHVEGLLEESYRKTMLSNQRYEEKRQLRLKQRAIEESMKKREEKESDLRKNEHNYHTTNVQGKLKKNKKRQTDKPHSNSAGSGFVPNIELQSKKKNCTNSSNFVINKTGSKTKFDEEDHNLDKDITMVPTDDGNTGHLENENDQLKFQQSVSGNSNSLNKLGVDVYHPEDSFQMCNVLAKKQDNGIIKVDENTALFPFSDTAYILCKPIYDVTQTVVRYDPIKQNEEMQIVFKASLNIGTATNIQQASFTHDVNQLSIQQSLSAPSIQQTLSAPSIQQPLSAPSIQQTLSAPSIQQPLSAPSIQQDCSKTSSYRVSTPSISQAIMNALQKAKENEQISTAQHPTSSSLIGTKRSSKTKKKPLERFVDNPAENKNNTGTNCNVNMVQKCAKSKVNRRSKLINNSEGKSLKRKNSEKQSKIDSKKIGRKCNKKMAKHSGKTKNRQSIEKDAVVKINRKRKIIDNMKNTCGSLENMNTQDENISASRVPNNKKSKIDDTENIYSSFRTKSTDTKCEKIPTSHAPNSKKSKIVKSDLTVKRLKVSEKLLNKKRRTRNSFVIDTIHNTENSIQPMNIKDNRQPITRIESLIDIQSSQDVKSMEKIELNTNRENLAKTTTDDSESNLYAGNEESENIKEGITELDNRDEVTVCEEHNVKRSKRLQAKRKDYALLLKPKAAEAKRKDYALLLKPKATEPKYIRPKNLTNDKNSVTNDENSVERMKAKLDANTEETINNSGIFKCSDCKVSFANYRHLIVHMLSHHYGNSCNICLSCGYGYKFEYGRGEFNEKLHNKSHNTPFNYSCEDSKCEQTFLSQELKDLHEEIHHKKKAWLQCDICLSFCKFPCYFSNHYKVCLKKKYLILSSENKINGEPNLLQLFNTLDLHKMGIEFEKSDISEKDGIFFCDFCGDRFKTYAEFYVHLNNHAGKSYICLTCGIGTARTYLKLWKRKHEEYHEKSQLKYSCDSCHDKFSRSELLDLHQQIHKGQSLLRCEYCMTDFTRTKMAYISHIKEKKCFKKKQKKDKSEKVKMSTSYHNVDKVEVKTGCGNSIALQLSDTNNIAMNESENLNVDNDKENSHVNIDSAFASTTSDKLSNTYNYDTDNLVVSGITGENSSALTSEAANSMIKIFISEASKVSAKVDSNNAEIFKSYDESNVINRQTVEEVDLGKRQESEDKIVQNSKTVAEKSVAEQQKERLKLLKDRLNQTGKAMVVNTEGINCKVCNKFLKFKKSYMCQHGRSYSYPNARICRLCGKIFGCGFKDKRLWTQHMMRSHSSKKCFKCCICGIEFALKTDFSKHMSRTHNNKHLNNEIVITGDHTYAKTPSIDVDLDDQRFTDDIKYKALSSSRTEDYMIHKDGKFICGKCGKILQSKKILKQHILSLHIGDKNKVCQICNTAFVFERYLKQHYRKVHSDISYACKLCSKVLKTKTGLDIHMKGSHKEFYQEKKMECYICKQLFTTLKELRQHKQSEHANLKFYCNICGRAYASRRGVRKHTERVHLKEIANISSIHNHPSKIVTNNKQIENLRQRKTDNVRRREPEYKIKTYGSSIQTMMDITHREVEYKRQQETDKAVSSIQKMIGQSPSRKEKASPSFNYLDTIAHLSQRLQSGTFQSVKSPKSKRSPKLKHSSSVMSSKKISNPTNQKYTSFGDEEQDSKSEAEMSASFKPGIIDSNSTPYKGVQLSQHETLGKVTDDSENLTTNLKNSDNGYHGNILTSNLENNKNDPATKPSDTRENENEITTDEFFICDECGKLLSSAKELAKHQKKIHTKSLFNCNFCGVVLENEKANKHRRKFHPKIRYNSWCFSQVPNVKSSGNKIPIPNVNNLSSANKKEAFVTHNKKDHEVLQESSEEETSDADMNYNDDEHNISDSGLHLISGNNDMAFDHKLNHEKRDNFTNTENISERDDFDNQIMYIATRIDESSVNKEVSKMTEKHTETQESELDTSKTTFGFIANDGKFIDSGENVKNCSEKDITLVDTDNSEVMYGPSTIDTCLVKEVNISSSPRKSAVMPEKSKPLLCEETNSVSIALSDLIESGKDNIDLILELDQNSVKMGDSKFGSGKIKNGKNNVSKTVGNTLHGKTRYKVIAKNDGDLVKTTVPTDHESDDIIHQVIDVPSELSKPYYSKINVPKIPKQTHKTVVNIPEGFTKVDIDIVNLETEDEDVYLFFTL